jgi:hypothetical protein
MAEALWNDYLHKKVPGGNLLSLRRILRWMARASGKENIAARLQPVPLASY